MESTVAQVQAYRLQHVQVGNFLSSLTNIISGVPQGSVFGTILFIIYINDSYDFFTGSSVILKLYANDTKLYSGIQCVHDVQYLQLGLDFIYNLYLAQQLSASVSKCTVLQLGRSLGTCSYKINNISLPLVS